MLQHSHLIFDYYRKTVPIPEDTPKVGGYDFNKGVDYDAVVKNFYTTGLQATNVALAIQQINKMIEKRSQPPLTNGEARIGHECPPSCSCQSSCTIFLSYTSNLVTSGIRDVIRFLLEHKMVDVVVTTAGGIEEDLMKCLAPFYLGDFTLPGGDLYDKGLNRSGNILVPDDNYAVFDKWITPILKQMLLEQNTEGARWTPSKMIHRLGKEINNPESICYWAYKNDITMYSPALTDGGIGDMLFLMAIKEPGLILDITEDICSLNISAVAAQCTGIIALGGGVPKHQICNANAWRDGANFAVYINTAQEFDGCDSGARPDEAVSWGKIAADAKPVKVHADASLVFPFIVGETFARHVHQKTLQQDKE